MDLLELKDNCEGHRKSIIAHCGECYVWREQGTLKGVDFHWQEGLVGRE